MTHYDVLIFGHLSKDFNITPEEEERSIGGAVVYAAAALQHLGANILAVTKLHPDDRSALGIFAEHGVPVMERASAQTTSIRNTYHSADRERRTCEALSVAAPFEVSDLPEDADAGVYYLGGLIKGEFSEAFVMAMADRGKIAIDVQGFLRVNEGGTMVFRDWPGKRQIIPSVHYLKTDAAEAEILTGEKEPEGAARILQGWGAQEVVLTHSKGVLVCTEGRTTFAPFTSRNLSGRTGRGDTCFSTYCYWRKDHGPEEACRFAAALTSLKMEKPGPFSGSAEAVNAAIRERYGT